MELEEALDILSQNGYTCTLDEDFCMGVGAPVGLDQGIPCGGDGKGCCPCPLEIGYAIGRPAKHPPKSASDALHPGYWLRQIKKRKKRRRHR